MNYSMTAFRRYSLVAGSLTIAATLAYMPVASASSSKAKTCVSGTGSNIKGASACAGLAYYAGKTVTLISETAAGTAIDIEDRLLAPVLSTFLHANVEVEDLGAAESIQGSDALAAASPNGLTIGGIETAADIGDILGGQTALNFNPAQLAYIAGTAASNDVLTMQASSPIKTFAQLLKSTSLSDPITEAGVTTGQSAMEMRLMSFAFGIHVSWVTGYSGSSVAFAGFERGDATMTFQPLSYVAPLVKSGGANALMVNIPIPNGNSEKSDVPKLDDIVQLGSKDRPKTAEEKQALNGLEALLNLNAFPWAAPSATPNSDLAILRTAFEYALKSPGIRKQFFASGNNAGYVSGPAAKASFVHLLSISKPLVKYLGASA